MHLYVYKLSVHPPIKPTVYKQVSSTMAVAHCFELKISNELVVLGAVCSNKFHQMKINTFWKQFSWLRKFLSQKCWKIVFAVKYRWIYLEKQAPATYGGAQTMISTTISIHCIWERKKRHRNETVIVNLLKKFLISIVFTLKTNESQIFSVV